MYGQIWGKYHVKTEKCIGHDQSIQIPRSMYN